MLAKFYLLAQLEASVMSNITQPLPKPTSISSALFFTLPGLSSPSFPLLSTKLICLLLRPSFKHYVPLASRSDAYFL